MGACSSWFHEISRLVGFPIKKHDVPHFFSFRHSVQCILGIRLGAVRRCCSATKKVSRLKAGGLAIHDLLDVTGVV